VSEMATSKIINGRAASRVVGTPRAKRIRNPIAATRAASRRVASASDQGARCGNPGHHGRSVMAKRHDLSVRCMLLLLQSVPSLASVGSPQRRPLANELAGD
jgi:hypothetical protein